MDDSPLDSVIPSQKGPTWKPHSGGAGAGGGSGGDCSGAGTCGRSGLERWVNPGDLETNSCMAIFGPLLILVRLNMPWPHCYQCIWRTLAEIRCDFNFRHLSTLKKWCHPMVPNWLWSFSPRDHQSFCCFSGFNPQTHLSQLKSIIPGFNDPWPILDTQKELFFKAGL